MTSLPEPAAELLAAAALTPLAGLARRARPMRAERLLAESPRGL